MLPPTANNDKRYAKLFFIVTVVLVALYAAIGMIFYSTEDGGPAHILGLSAIPFAVLTIIFFQRSRHQKNPTTLRKYSANILVTALLTPVWLFVSYLYAILGWASSEPSSIDPVSSYEKYFGALAVPAIVVGLAGLILIVLNRYKIAGLCFSLFSIPGIFWLLNQ